MSEIIPLLSLREWADANFKKVVQPKWGSIAKLKTVTKKQRAQLIDYFASVCFLRSARVIDDEEMSKIMDRVPVERIMRSGR